MSFTPITLQALRLRPDGTPASGKFTITLTATMRNGSAVVNANAVTGTLGPLGTLLLGVEPLALLAVDDSGTVPAGPSAAYRITEEISGLAPTTYDVYISNSATITETAGTTRTTSPVVVLSSVAACETMVGQPVTGTNIQGGTVVDSVDPVANTITLSHNPTTNLTKTATITIGGAVDLSTLQTYSPAPAVVGYVPFVPGGTTGYVLTWNGSAYVPEASSGGVATVSAGDSTITIGGTSSNPTVSVSPGTFDAYGAASTALSSAESFATSAVGTETARAEAAEATLVPKSGTTMTGPLILSADPTSALGAATKQYVDAVASGLSPKSSVVALSASNIASLSGTPTIDGFATSSGQRVLLIGQSTPSQNGLWVVAAGAWSRPADFAAGSVQLGTFTFVENGSVYQGSGFVLVGAAVTVGTSSQTWTQFSGTGEITAGSGLLKSGATLSVDTSVIAALASPAFSGNPTAPTQSGADSSTKLATTAFVQTAAGLLIPSSQKGAANGVATLDSGGQVPAGQLGNVSAGGAKTSWRPGYWYPTNNYALGSGSTDSFNLIILNPFLLTGPTHTFVKLGIYVLTQSDPTCSYRLGIYEDVGLLGYPNTLVLDAGTVDTSTATGLVTKTISQSLTFGHSYYLCYRPEGSGAIASIQDAENPINNFIGMPHFLGTFADVDGAFPSYFAKSAGGAGLPATIAAYPGVDPDFGVVLAMA